MELAITSVFFLVKVGWHTGGRRGGGRRGTEWGVVPAVIQGLVVAGDGGMVCVVGGGGGQVLVAMGNGVVGGGGPERVSRPLHG